MLTQIATSPPAPPAQVAGHAPAAFDNALSTAVWKGAIAARRELNDQRNSLQGTRRGVADQLRNPMVDGADRRGLERQIVDLDARIAVVDKDLAAANARVASAALIPGAVVEPRRERDGPPQEMYVLSGLFMVLVLFPLSVALARRIWRRGAAAMIALPQEMVERFTRLDQAMDAMAVEVERIGESQRFVTRLMSERATPDPLALERDRSSPR
jgi:hypothetical protein